MPHPIGSAPAPEVGPGGARPADSVRCLALGLAALGRPAYQTVGHGDDVAGDRDPVRLEARAHAVLDAAYAAGVRSVDVARSYGEGERFLRDWLEARAIAPGAVEVGSKWGYRYVGAWRLDVDRHEVKDHTLDMLRAQAAETRALLGPWLTRYQVHSVVADDPLFRDAAVLDELARLRDAGWSIGATVSGAGQPQAVARLLELRRGGAPLFDSIQATWNVLEPSCAAALRSARDAGRLVIVKEPLANGRLTVRGREGQTGAVAAVAKARGTTPDVVALAAALAQPWADRVLLGPVTVAQLESNLGAAALQLTREELDALAAAAEPAEAYWEHRATMRWT